MPTSETIHGPTPAGGTSATIHYLDDAGQPVEKDVATRAEIVEVDAAGQVVARTYLTVEPGAARDVPRFPGR